MTGRQHPAPEELPAQSVTARRGPSRGWVYWVVVVVFALLYTQDLFQAVTDAFGVPADIGALNALRAEAELPPLAVPWAPIIINLALPPVLFGAALVISRRRTALVAALVLAVGLAIVAVVTLDMYLLAGLLVA